MKILHHLLKQSSVSGNESQIGQFLLDTIEQRKNDWKVCPQIYSGEDFHDCILLKFGNPRTALFAHMDTIGFMTRYENQLIPVGGPETEDGMLLIGEDELGPIECRLKVENDSLFHDFQRPIQPGTYLSFAQNIRVDGEFIQAAYLDNRLGLFTALQVCENLEHGWVVFSTYEEHGGGSMPFLLKFIQENHPIRQALIADITWVTEGVVPHEGVAISIRDRYIPRRKFIDRVIALATQSKIPFQLEVEASGGSDGREIQFSPYPIDWCFVGAAEDNVHSPDEKVSLADLDSMIKMHQYLMKHL
ncbi:M20/M25/M40 family metallo-hydrolase [Algoriphagus marincola]|uniref:M20/M25/M40 family metallo-hydrolase n=1 Tax=Algoriphagus marincola TaxID=264027 RepID=A0ABS7N801_9BACT|nr:M20/M25/M40 family metallo-hydrolase [Algoriphagus marincola]MBY5952120.1 M20/M25/M40 family metallo-hydrolase [Algoriphagus marincola]